MNSYEGLAGVHELARVAKLCDKELKQTTLVTASFKPLHWYAAIFACVNAVEGLEADHAEVERLCELFSSMIEKIFVKDLGCKAMLLYELNRAKLARLSSFTPAKEANASYVETYLGEQFDPLRPYSGNIHLEDIAHALSNLCRFNGHTGWFYSVAQHSVLVSRAVPKSLALEGLLHDAGEAYLPACPLTIQQWFYLGRYFDATASLINAIADKFGLVDYYQADILAADLMVRDTELRDVMGNVRFAGHVEPNSKRTLLAEKIVPLDAIDAEQLFLDEFDRIMETRDTDVARNKKD